MAWLKLAICPCARVRGRSTLSWYNSGCRVRTERRVYFAVAGAFIVASRLTCECPLHQVRPEQDRVEFAHLYRGIVTARSPPSSWCAIEVLVPDLRNRRTQHPVRRTCRALHPHAWRVEYRRYTSGEAEVTVDGDTYSTYPGGPGAARSASAASGGARHQGHCGAVITQSRSLYC